jgi:hypothetical protein
MAHISSIGAGIYTDLSVAVPATDPNFSTLVSAATWQPLFATEITASGTAAANTFIRIQNVREFPSIGTPPNIVNVPVYGAKTSRQVQGQADAPTIELTLNYVASDWASTTTLGATVGNGRQYSFRFTLLNSQPTAYASTAAGLGTAVGGAAGSCQNSQWYWYGKMESLLVNPQLTDANTATLTISVQSDFYGSYTV